MSSAQAASLCNKHARGELTFFCPANNNYNSWHMHLPFRRISPQNGNTCSLCVKLKGPLVKLAICDHRSASAWKSKSPKGLSRLAAGRCSKQPRRQSAAESVDYFREWLLS